MAVISLIIGLHYEVLRNCIRMLPAVKRRRRVVILILIIMMTHAAEIWIFGLAFRFLAVVNRRTRTPIPGTRFSVFPRSFPSPARYYASA